MFAIHNLSHQGVEPAATFPNLGLPDDWCASGFASHGMIGSVSFQHRFSCLCAWRMSMSAPCQHVFRCYGLHNVKPSKACNTTCGTICSQHSFWGMAQV